MESDAGLHREAEELVKSMTVGLGCALDFSAKIEQYVFSDYLDAGCSDAFSEVAGPVRQRRPESVINHLKKIIASEAVELPHPLLTGVNTTARFNLQLNMINFVFFAAADGSCKWILIQLTNFIDAVVVPNRLLFVSNMQKPAVKKCFAQLLRENPDINAFFSKNDKFTGFLVSQRTPFHFFYDLFKNLAQLADVTVKSGKKIRYQRAQLFYPIEAVSPALQHGDIGIAELLIYPASIAQSAMNALGKRYAESVLLRDLEVAAGDDVVYVRHQMDVMEKMVLDYSLFCDIGVHEISGFVLWIGISEVKRSWIEQHDGYAKLITALSEIYGEMTVLFDGMTAPVGSKIDYEADDSVVKAICAKIPRSVNCLSMAGMEYCSKVALGSRVDLFLSDSGTAAMVPLRFCRKPGVLFSNGSINSFPDVYGERVRYIDPELVRVPEVDVEKKVQFRSFHMYWKDLLSAALSLARPAQVDLLNVCAQERRDYFRQLGCD